MTTTTATAWTRTLPSTERATLLAETFHVLVGAPGVRPWDAQELDEWASSGASEAERYAAAFVLQVYNLFNDWQTGPLDIVDAMCIWDQHNKAAFQAWAMDPFFL